MCLFIVEQRANNCIVKSPFQDNLQGINVKVSASMIMGLLFGFEEDAYWRQAVLTESFSG
jgi:hypothetical protein